MMIKLIRTRIEKGAENHQVKCLEQGQPITLKKGITLKFNAQEIDPTSSNPSVRLELSDNHQSRSWLISPNQVLDLREWKGLVVYPLAVGFSHVPPFVVKTIFIRIDDWNHGGQLNQQKEFNHEC